MFLYEKGVGVQVQLSFLKVGGRVLKQRILRPADCLAGSESNLRTLNAAASTLNPAPRSRSPKPGTLKPEP